MAYIAMTVRGGTHEGRERVRQALTNYFENAWGEVVVELTHDGSRWNIDRAWSKPPGGATPTPESWDCRERVATALAMAGTACRSPQL